MILTESRGLMVGLETRELGRHEGVTTCNFACALGTERWPSLWAGVLVRVDNDKELFETSLWSEPTELTVEMLGFAAIWDAAVLELETEYETAPLVLFCVGEFFTNWWHFSDDCLEHWAILVKFSGLYESILSLLDRLSFGNSFLLLLNLPCAMAKLDFTLMFSFFLSVKVTELSFEELSSPAFPLFVKISSDRKSNPREKVGSSFISMATSSSVISMATAISFRSWSWKMLLGGGFLAIKRNNFCLKTAAKGKILHENLG